MSNNLITELGDKFVTETVSGIADASSLNDISVVTINKETFDTDPTNRGWLYGADWEWDSINQRMKIS